MFFVFYKLRIDQLIRSQNESVYALIGLNHVTVKGKRIRLMEIRIPVEICKEVTEKALRLRKG